MAPVSLRNNASGSSTSGVRKRKKPPACDYCKARRVICHPQPDGKPCPRCVEKEVTCTTTPVVRRKPRRRAEDSDEAAPAPAPAPAPPAPSNTPSQNSSSSASGSGTSKKSTEKSPPAPAPAPPPPKPPAFKSSNAVLSWRDAHPLPCPLVEELIKLFPFLPQCQLPIIPYRRLHDQLEACEWDLSRLDTHMRVLAQAIIAVTARASTNPLIVGADVDDAQLVDFLSSGNLMVTPGLDLRQLGRRRDAICRRLQDEACQAAFETGITMVTSEENAASCYLLDFLESSTDCFDNPLTWTAAMMWHIRALAEDEEHEEMFSVNYRRLHWPIQLMNCALLALCSGRSIPFTEHDERLICGSAPVDIETATLTLANQPVTGQAIGEFIYPFLSHVIHLARQSSESVIGPYAKRFPLNEATLISHLAAVEALQKTCVFLHDCIEFAIPRAKRDWVRPALANGLFITGLAVPSLLVPLHKELKRRLAEGSVTTMHRGSDGIGEFSVDTTSRTHERIELLHRQVRAMALHAVAQATRRARDLPSLMYMTHLQCSRFAAWIDLFVEECDPGDIPPLERYECLERMCAIIKLDGFAWVDRSGSLARVEGEMNLLQAQQQLVPHFTPRAWADNLDLGSGGGGGGGTAFDDNAFGDLHDNDDLYENAWNMSMGSGHALSSARISQDFSSTNGMSGMLDTDSRMLEQALLQSNFL
ncbi:hypothetical protein EV714DRAFT_253939 [Schizophyllum commune]